MSDGTKPNDVAWIAARTLIGVSRVGKRLRLRAGGAGGAGPARGCVKWWVEGAPTKHWWFGGECEHLGLQMGGMAWEGQVGPYLLLIPGQSQ